jgi:hypothetical protein
VAVERKKGLLSIRVAGLFQGDAVTRFSVSVGCRWLAATYDNGPGMVLTYQREDACSWVTMERACDAARLATDFFNIPAAIVVAEEPDYPRSWSATGAEAA